MTSASLSDPADLLNAYDQQLRGQSELTGASDISADGPLLRARFGRGGFVTGRDLPTGEALDALIERTIAYFRDQTDVGDFEWKTRSHDEPADLTARLVAHGFEPDEEETVMVGAVEHLVHDIDLPAGVVVRQAGDGGDFAADVDRAATMQAAVFGDGPRTEETLDRLVRSGGSETLWLAEVDAQVICAGRLGIVDGTEFAGLWGGATVAEWRGKGIYRALTAARARHAQQRGVHYLHSDCSPMSRPILERSGLVKVTTTTPYNWTR